MHFLFYCKTRTKFCSNEMSFTEHKYGTFVFVLDIVSCEEIEISRA
jgi:hypothetical protein